MNICYRCSQNTKIKNARPKGSYMLNPMGMLREFPRVEILWKSYGNSHINPVGMEWELKFPSHGNPVIPQVK